MNRRTWAAVQAAAIIVALVTAVVALFATTALVLEYDTAPTLEWVVDQRVTRATWDAPASLPWCMRGRP